MNKILLYTILGLFIAGVGVYAFTFMGPDAQDITAVSSFEECVEAGNPVMESYPRQCRTEDGRLFIEEIDEPLPGEEDPVSGDEGEERPAGAYDGCVITGCSSQVCAEEEMATTCEYRQEYSCYQDAVCERQEDGQCGWTETEELALCLSNAI